MDKIKTWAILGLAAMGLALCGGMITTGRMASETVQQFAPIPRATADIALDRRRQEAQVTATYIAVLESEVVSDTMTTHRLQREGEQEAHERNQALAETVTIAKQWGVGALAFGVVIAFIGLGVKFAGAWAADGVKAAREAVMPLPQLTRPLPDGVHLLTDGRATDTRSLASWSVVDDMQPTMEQAQALAEIRRAVYGEIVRAIVSLMSGRQITREAVER